MMKGIIGGYKLPVAALNAIQELPVSAR